MNLAVILSIGETWEELLKKGQADLLIRENFSYYSQNFNQVNIFHYGHFEGELLPHVYLKANQFGLHRFIYVWLLPFLYRKEFQNSDLIRGMQLTSAISGLVAKHLYSKPLVINYGFDYTQVAYAEGKYIRGWLLRFFDVFIPYINAVITTTPFLWSKLKKQNSQVYYIPNGINTDVFKPIPRKKEISILFVGRFEKQKNLELLIKATSLVKKSVELVFVGEGSLKNELGDLARKMHVKITIEKPVLNRKLVDYYNQSKIFVLPSLIEGHPKALLEAMSCRMAVIGTQTEGIREVIKNNHNGVLVDFTPSALAQAIYQLLQNQKLRLLYGVNARAHIIKQFSSKKTWMREIRLLKKIAQTTI